MNTYIVIYKPKRYNVGKNPVRRLLQLNGSKNITFPVINKKKVVKFNSELSREELEEYLIFNCEYVDSVKSFDNC